MARSVRNVLPCIVIHTWAGVSGMSAWRTPYGLSASITALTTAGGEPTVADSPTPLTPSGWCGDGVTVSPSSNVGHLHRGRQQVVHERPAEAVAVLVERDHLHQRHADAVGETAVDLALDDHRVDARAAVVDGDEPPDLHLPGAGVDVDDADVGAERVGEVRRVVDRLGVEVALDALGQLEVRVREQGDLLDRLALLGVALHVPAAELPLEVVGRALERRGGDDLGLVATRCDTTAAAAPDTGVDRDP